MCALRKTKFYYSNKYNKDIILVLYPGIDRIIIQYIGQNAKEHVPSNYESKKREGSLELPSAEKIPMTYSFRITSASACQKQAYERQFLKKELFFLFSKGVGTVNNMTGNYVALRHVMH